MKERGKKRRNRNCHVRFVAPLNNTCCVCAFTNRIYRLEKRRMNVLPCLFSPSPSVCAIVQPTRSFFFSLSITSQWVSRKREKECFLCRGFFFPVTRFPCRFIFFFFLVTSVLRILREAAESFYDVLQVFLTKRVPIAIQLFFTTCAFTQLRYTYIYIYIIWRETRVLFFYLYGFYVSAFPHFL